MSVQQGDLSLKFFSAFKSIDCYSISRVPRYKFVIVTVLTAHKYSPRLNASDCDAITRLCGRLPTFRSLAVKYKNPAPSGRTRRHVNRRVIKQTHYERWRRGTF